MSRIKVVGYAKKDFFSNGIEYRNFSPDLVGTQFTSDGGTPIFTSGNFSISTNLNSKVDKEFVTNAFSDFISLNSLNLDEQLEKITLKYSKQVKLNLDNTDMLTYARFGSLKEYIRVSLENIIINWVASLYVTEIDRENPNLTGNTVDSHSYNTLSGTTTFTVNTNRIENLFKINYVEGTTLSNTFNETNPLRDLTLAYTNYVISNEYGTFPITNLLGATGLTNSTITITTTGNPFPNYGSEIINYHIKPNSKNVEEFFLNLNEFENNLLNRLTTPKYTGEFKVYNETDTGVIVETTKQLTWPVSDGYNIDFNTIDYSIYVTELLNIAEINDNSKSDLMVRFLVSQSISEFDSIPDINGTYLNSNGQKMTNTLKIYGREFDEVTNYIHGISYANVVTYDKKNNTPDVVLKNLARVLGWELTTSITEIDVLSNFLSLNSNNYDGYSRGLSDAEIEIELWRRIVLNTPWIWKSKGTRKAIEFLFKFMGVPNGLVNFNEHLYVAEEPVDIALLIEMMEYYNNTTDIEGLVVDSEGYPFILPDTSEMYFQKAGLWYRTTGGPTPDIDILTGNNPHIGPYDGGQAYIEQFTKCLIPNYVDCSKPVTSGGTGICDEYIPTYDTVKNFQVFEYSGGRTTIVPSVECCHQYGFIETLFRNGDISCILNTKRRKAQIDDIDNGIYEICEPTGYTTNLVNLFTNYGIGTFNECCSGDKYVNLTTDHDFDAILEENIDKVIKGYPVVESGCTFTNTWTVTAFLAGESFYINDFFSGATAPTETDYVNELLNLSGTTELSGSTFTYDSNTSILKVSTLNDCKVTSIDEEGPKQFVQASDDLYLKIEMCVSTDFDCDDVTIPNLTRFTISDKADDACNPFNALQLTLNYYHSGTGLRPTVGDYVYEDENGITPAEFVSEQERFMGGNWTDSTNWLRTDASGQMLLITCSPKVCLVQTGQGIVNIKGETSQENNMFWIDGLTQPRNVHITYELFDVVLATDGSRFSVDITDGTNSYRLTENAPQVSIRKLVSPNGGVNSNGQYDYDTYITNGGTPITWKVRMIVTYVEDECIENSNVQTISRSVKK